MPPNVPCRYWAQGHCGKGANCTFAHGDPVNNQNRFSAFNQNSSQQTTRFGGDKYRPGGNAGSPDDAPYNVRATHIEADLKNERPIWPFSAYGPGKDAPRQLFGGFPIEQSPEEMRMRAYLAVANGNAQSIVQEETALLQQVNGQIDNCLKDLPGAVLYVVNGRNEHPNRNDLAKADGSAPSASTTGAFGASQQTAQPSFGQPSAFGKPAFGQASQPAATNTFGSSSTFGKPSAPAFGQPSGLSNASPFGQPSALGQTSAFGKPSMPASTSTFGQPAATPAFGQPSQPAQTSAFGQPSKPGPVSAFGQPSQPTPAFGQSPQPAQTSTFGQSSQPTAGPAFGQPSQPQNSAFGQPSQPGATSAFGQPSKPAPAPTSAFGQPSKPAPTSAFGQPSQPTTTSAFGQPSQPAATPAFGQSSQAGASSAFGKPAFGAPAFGQATQATNANAQPPPNGSVFGQSSQPANPFGQRQTPQTNGFGPAAAKSNRTGGSFPPLNNAPRAGPAGGKLTSFNGAPVVWQDWPPQDPESETKVIQHNLPFYQRGRELERLWFPELPKHRNEAAEPEIPQGTDINALMEAYKFAAETGTFKDGRMPEIAPKLEWVNFDI